MFLKGFKYCAVCFLPNYFEGFGSSVSVIILSATDHCYIQVIAHFNFAIYINFLLYGNHYYLLLLVMTF